MNTLKTTPYHMTTLSNKIEEIVDILISDISIDAKTNAIAVFNETIVDSEKQYTENEVNVNHILSEMCDKAYSLLVANSEDFTSLAYHIDNALCFFNTMYEIDITTEDGDELNRLRIDLCDSYASLIVYTESRKNNEDAYVEDNENEFTLSEKYNDIYISEFDELESKYFTIL